MTQVREVRGVATSVLTDEHRETHVIYHGTTVVTIHRDGRVTLRTGGWRTNTTRLRMNQASHQYQLGYQVYQKDFDWFVQMPSGTVTFNGDEITLPAER